MDSNKLDAGIAFIRRNKLVLALIGIGAIVVLATVWTGAIIGVLIGGVISFSQREKELPNEKKRRR